MLERPHHTALLWTGMFALAVGACAAPTRPDEPPEAPAPTPGIYHVESGDELERRELFDRLAGSDFVIVGESHDSEWHHRLQKDIFAALLERRPGEVALGMEMFERPVQSALDAYVTGEIDEATMLERTNWANSWGMPPELYRPLWTLARDRGAPIAALNVPRQLTRAIARHGLDGLSEDQRARLPATIDTGYPAQRDYLETVFGGGTHSNEMEFEHFLQAQATWDETMAESAVDFLRDREAVETMMIVTGRVHARKAFGIPPRIVRRLRDAGDSDPVGRVVSLLPFSTNSEIPEGQVTLERLRENEAADYVWIEDPE